MTLLDYCKNVDKNVEIRKYKIHKNFSKRKVMINTFFEVLY